MADFNWKEESAFANTVTAVETVKKKAVSNIGGHMTVVCLVAVVALEILRHFVTYGINSDFAWNMVFSAMIDSVSSFFAFYLFFPNGRTERAAREPYQKSKGRIQAAVNRIKDGGYISDFCAWCRQKAQAEEREERAARMDTLEALYVTREEYETKYRTMPRRSLRRAVRNGEITAAAMRQILICRSPIQIKPYVPAYFLSGTEKNHHDSYLHGGSKYGAISLAMKPVTLIAFVIARNLFDVNGAENISVMATIVAITISIFLICFSSFAGYRAGWKTAEHEEIVMDTKSWFMEEFCKDAQTKNSGAA